MSFEQSYYENADIWLMENFSEADLNRVSELAHHLPDDAATLLDVGCGNGLFLKFLLERRPGRFARLCGTDRSNAALEYVQTEKVQASVDALPFADREFELVTCMEVLEHLPQATYQQALIELSRVAGRYLLVSVPYDEKLRLSYTECSQCLCRFNPHYHLRSFTKESMRHLFDGKGFSSREIFFLQPQKQVSYDVEVAMRSLGVVKRKLLRQPPQPMAVTAVCPACGYTPVKERGKQALSEVVKPSFGMRLRTVLATEDSWRWIAAIYQRD